MLQRVVIILAICLFSTPGFSLETDNFLVWGKQLEDSSEQINAYINNKVRLVLNEINSKRRKRSCEKVRDKIINSFRGFITHPMEHWAEANLEVFPSESISSDRDYSDISIYSTSYFDFRKYISLSRNININGVYMGTDKLSHWMSTGERYYRRYMRALNSGKSIKDAYREAINYGIFLDRYVLGGYSSGVFSLADLEANFQGMLFNEKFCQIGESDNFITSKNGLWSLQHEIDVRNYVNPNWDETFNPSFFAPRTWKKVKKNFLKENCQKISENVFKDRFERYRKMLIPSFSFKYIESMKRKGYRLPKYSENNYKNICPI